MVPRNPLNTPMEPPKATRGLHIFFTRFARQPEFGAPNVCGSGPDVTPGSTHLVQEIRSEIENRSTPLKGKIGAVNYSQESFTGELSPFTTRSNLIRTFRSRLYNPSRLQVATYM